MVKRIELRYPLSCSNEGERIVPKSLRRGRMRLTDVLMHTYMNIELLKERIVGGEVEAEFQNESLGLVTTFWSPDSLSDRVKSLLTKYVSGQLSDGMGESGFVVLDGGRELSFEVTDYDPVSVSEIDDVQAPYPVPFVAMAAFEGDENALRTALEQHPDCIDAAFIEGNTALHHSLAKPALLRMLLNAGANPNIVDVASLTPLNKFLFFGDLSEAETLDVVQMLMDAGADPSIVDYKDETAVDNAKASGKDFVLPLLSRSSGRRT